MIDLRNGGMVARTNFVVIMMRVIHQTVYSYNARDPFEVYHTQTD